jgi:hypothetical protein
MQYPEEIDDLRRLQDALESISTDLDKIEQRPHYSLHFAAAGLVEGQLRGIEAVVSKFAVAIERTR